MAPLTVRFAARFAASGCGDSSRYAVVWQLHVRLRSSERLAASHLDRSDRRLAAVQLPDLHPLPIPCRPLDGVEHTLVLVAVLEAGCRQRLLCDRTQKIVDGVRERV